MHVSEICREENLSLHMAGAAALIAPSSSFLERYDKVGRVDIAFPREEYHETIFEPKMDGSRDSELLRGVRERGVDGFPAWFTGTEVMRYMSSFSKAKALVEACLGFDQTIEGNVPLQRLLALDTRPHKNKSAAYLYAFRRLMFAHAFDGVMVSLDSLLALDIPVSSIVRSWLIDVPKIVLQFPYDVTSDAYYEVTSRPYVYAISYLLANSPSADLVQAYCRFQLLFPLSGQSIIAHIWPLLGQDADTAFFQQVGNISAYPLQITWLMEQVFIKGWSAQPENLEQHPNGLEMEFTEVMMDVTSHFFPDDMKWSRDVLAKAARGTGKVAKDVIDDALATWEAIGPGELDIPEVQRAQRAILEVMPLPSPSNTYGYLGLLDLEQARDFMVSFAGLDYQPLLNIPMDLLAGAYHLAPIRPKDL